MQTCMWLPGNCHRRNCLASHTLDLPRALNCLPKRLFLRTHPASAVRPRRCFPTPEDIFPESAVTVPAPVRSARQPVAEKKRQTSRIATNLLPVQSHHGRHQLYSSSSETYEKRCPTEGASPVLALSR